MIFTHNGNGFFYCQGVAFVSFDVTNQPKPQVPLRYLAEVLQIVYFFRGFIVKNSPNVSRAERTGICVTFCSNESPDHRALKARAAIHPQISRKQSSHWSLFLQRFSDRWAAFPYLKIQFIFLIERQRSLQRAKELEGKFPSASEESFPWMKVVKSLKPVEHSQF